MSEPKRIILEDIAGMVIGTENPHYRNPLRFIPSAELGQFFILSLSATERETVVQVRKAIQDELDDRNDIQLSSDTKESNSEMLNALFKGAVAGLVSVIPQIEQINEFEGLKEFHGTDVYQSMIELREASMSGESKVAAAIAFVGSALLCLRPDSYDAGKTLAERYPAFNDKDHELILDENIIRIMPTLLPALRVIEASNGDWLKLVEQTLQQGTVQ